MSRFRDFLYIDGDTIESLLAGVEGGSYESVDERWRHSDKSRSLTGAEAEPGMSEDSTTVTLSEQRRRILQNAEARFTRLWETVNHDSDETVLDDRTDLSSLEHAATVGSFCMFTGRLYIPALLAVLSNATELQSVAQLLERWGALPPGSDDIVDKLDALTNAKDLLAESFPITLQLGSQRPTVILPLQPQKSRISINQFIGQATVFGRVVDNIDSDSSYALLTLPGAAHLPKMSRQQRRRAERDKSATSEAPTEVRGPALVVKPLAIFQ
ncbi:DUF6414 family protein [Nocardia cyriacigeorgica]|uniref:DUF6414 family protein n=1 Tax=Nocardia cyriacigeorgica TaxID=135487 RepID=UPI0018936010|nr:hypothetical protein [Nocardia cyriacigeorgica]MBF6439272.1 hypothetical protein [Nocardia cyriacigeorgica]